MMTNFNDYDLIMQKNIYCSKLKENLPSMSKPPFPGDFGTKIFNQISQKAWDAWVLHQTMLINEYRLNLSDAKARQFLRDEMEKYFFGEGSNKPEGYVDQN